MGPFHDDGEARITQIGGQAAQQLSIQEHGEPRRRRGQQHRPRPPWRLHAPIDHKRYPEEGHGRKTQPRQRLHPDPAAGLPPERREHPLQGRHISPLPMKKTLPEP